MLPGLPAISPRYRVDREIGRGGMGSVYLATDTTLSRQVAIKLLHGAQLDAPTSVSRFIQEGRVCAQLRSDHCVKVFDLGVTDNGQPYLVMEFLHGRDLAHELVRTGRFSCERAMSYVTQACSALAEAHQLGVVHRDLKPHNLFLCQGPQGEETVKVLDFGVSRLPKATTTEALTARGDVLGTPAYMSPEQIAGRDDVDARSDIWALGVILYELVCGTTPFSGDTATQNIFRILNEQAQPLSHIVPGVPPAFEALVGKCLRKDRDERYQNVAALVRDLAQVAQAENRLRSVHEDGSHAIALRPTDLAQPAISAPPPQARTLQSIPVHRPYSDAASLASYSHTPPIGSYRMQGNTSSVKVLALIGVGLASCVGLGAGAYFGFSGIAGDGSAVARPVAPPKAPATAQQQPATPHAPVQPITWNTTLRSAGGYSPVHARSQTEPAVATCAKANETKLRDAYSPTDLRNGFGVMISYNPAGIVTMAGADGLPNIGQWMQACLNESLLGKEMGRPPKIIEHRDIYLFVTASP